MLILSAILISLAPADFCGASRPAGVAALIWQAHIVGALDDERGDTVGEFLRELLARGAGVLDRVMQPAGRNEFGVGAIGRSRKQVRDLGEVVDVRLMAAALARHPVVPARGEFGGFGDEADR